MRIVGRDLKAVELVRCPTCGAEPGWTCTTKGFGGDRAAHVKRLEAAKVDRVAAFDAWNEAAGRPWKDVEDIDEELLAGRVL